MSVCPDGGPFSVQAAAASTMSRGGAKKEESESWEDIMRELNDRSMAEDLRPHLVQHKVIKDPNSPIRLVHLQKLARRCASMRLCACAGVAASVPV